MAFERFDRAALLFWAAMAALAVILVGLGWYQARRLEARDRDLCRRICAPAAPIWDSAHGCFCAGEGTACRRF